MRFANKLIPLFALLLINASLVQAQHFPKSDRFKVSLNMGVNLSTVTGTELQENTFKPGLLIGVDYRQKLGKSPLQLRTGLQAAYRGSRFSHTEGDHYYKLNLVYAELPVDLMFGIGESKTFFITAGGSINGLLQSEIFVRPDFTARDEFNNTGFTTFDYTGRIGYLMDFYYMAWSLNVQFGLKNINNNLLFTDVLPETGKNGMVKNIGINTTIHF